ncbi:MAG TPA: HD domain-containing protein, partial [Burkholderiaceae bacterium]|nr:HD domain-containing protein [Burkholderiaceae bacterium]
GVRTIDNDFQVVNYRLDIRDDHSLQTTPSLIFQAFLAIQQRPQLQGMSARLLRALWHARRQVDASFRQQAENRDLFLQILRQNNGVAEALAHLNAFNILPRYIPAFRRIVGQMQHDLFHVYTVDEHTLKVVRNLSRFRMASHADEYPQASQLATSFDSPWLLHAAAIFHDIAKGQGGNHASRGAGHARRFALDHGLSEADTDLIVFLVTHHLNMSHTAQKRDLSDPDVIHDFATLVGSVRYLDALYLLTVADIRATRPNLWNSWKGKLLDDLYQRTLIALDGDLPDMQAVMAQRQAQAREEAAALGLPAEQMDALWSVLDMAYFLRHEAHDMLWHAEQIGANLQPPGPCVRARTVGQNEAVQVMLWTADQPDLFSRICRYFERSALSIQDARIHTTSHGYALDSFVATSNEPDTLYATLVDTLQEQLTEFLKIPAEALMSQTSTPSPLGHAQRRQAQVFPIHPEVRLTRLNSDQQWELSVTGIDRPGLLRALASIFNEQGVDLKMAKIHTLGQRIEDSFVLQGEALEHTASRNAFEAALLAVLENNLPSS